MLEVSAIIVAAFVFAVAIAYAINKNSKGEPAKKPALAVPVAPGSVAAPKTVTLPGGGTVPIPDIPAHAPTPSPSSNPKPKKKKAKASSTKAAPVEGVAPDGTKEPPPINTWKF